MRMRKVSSGHLLSIHENERMQCCIQWVCKRTVKALTRLRGHAGWSWPSLPAYPRRHVSLGAAYLLIVISLSLDFNLYLSLGEFSRRHFFLFFSFIQKIGFDISYKFFSSLRRQFVWYIKAWKKNNKQKKKKKKIKMSSADIFTQQTER